MARIRTIKPSFFKSYKLYCADKEAGLPLRLAFAGLWTVADREGRFQWIPQELKVDCLPHDEVDFSRVLDALWTRGYIDKYEVEGHQYGVIPTFPDHQVINNRESGSVLPEPNEINTLTRAAPVTRAKRTALNPALVEGKGKEGKGKEGSKSRAHALPQAFGLTENRIAYAKSKGIRDPAAEMEAFRAHHEAHGKTMRDWDAAWRTWCLNSKKFAGRGQAQQPASKPPKDFPA